MNGLDVTLIVVGSVVVVAAAVMIFLKCRK